MNYKHSGIIKLDINSIITILAYMRNMEGAMEDKLLAKKVDILKAVSQSTRIRILNLLRNGEKCICKMVPELGGRTGKYIKASCHPKACRACRV